MTPHKYRYNDHAGPGTVDVSFHGDFVIIVDNQGRVNMADIIYLRGFMHRAWSEEPESAKPKCWKCGINLIDNQVSVRNHRYCARCVR